MNKWLTGLLVMAIASWAHADEFDMQAWIDDQVDALYNQINRDLLSLLQMQPNAVERANHLLWAAHNLERYADRTINICERVEYMCTGVYREADTLEFGLSGVN